jgi:hypothetical protein
MRILLTDTHYLQHGWANALKELGCEVILWNEKSIPAFDIFYEFEPDILIAQSSDINRALFKCIMNNRQNLTSFFWLKDWYTATPAERETILYLNNETRVIGLSPHLEGNTCNTHLSWITNKVEVRSSLPAASISKGKFCEEFICDLAYYGEQYPDMNEFLIPFLNVNNLNVKIFSENPYWTHANHLGYLRGQRLADLYATASLSLCLLPSSCDVDETIFNVLAAGGTPVVKPNSSILEIFSETNTLFVDNRYDLEKRFHQEFPKGGNVPTYIDRVKQALPEVL